MKPFLLLALWLLPVLAPAGELPATLMTVPGKLLVDQDFSAPLKPFDGKSNGFASGFQGWRWNAVPRGGTWKIENGTFLATENPGVKHPATASYGFDFKDVVIECDVRMTDAPAEGLTGRRISVRTTDDKDYVCSVHLDPAGFRISKDDNDHGGPDKAVILAKKELPLEVGTWHHVVLEILGEEMVGTVDGHSLTGNHSLISREKRSVMFTIGVQGAVRNFKVWEAAANPGWESRKAVLRNPGKP